MDQAPRRLPVAKHFQSSAGSEPGLVVYVKHRQQSERLCMLVVQHRKVRAHEVVAYFDYATVKNSQQGAEVKILVGAVPRGETFARAVHRKSAKFECLEPFLKVLQTRCGTIPVYCDQEECLREVVHSTAGRLGMPRGLTAVEQSQANGRAEQRV